MDVIADDGEGQAARGDRKDDPPQASIKNGHPKRWPLILAGWGRLTGYLFCRYQ